MRKHNAAEVQVEGLREVCGSLPERRIVSHTELRITKSPKNRYERRPPPYNLATVAGPAQGRCRTRRRPEATSKPLRRNECIEFLVLELPDDSNDALGAKTSNGCIDSLVMSMQSETNDAHRAERMPQTHTYTSWMEIAIRSCAT